MAIRFTRDFNEVFKLLSLLKADNVVRIDYSSPDGRGSDTDHWIQIRDVMSLGCLQLSVESLTVLEETMNMAEIYDAGNHLGPIEIEDIEDDWSLEDLEDEQAHEEQLSNLLAINFEACVNHKEFIGPIEPTEQMLRRLDMPF